MKTALSIVSLLAFSSLAVAQCELERQKLFADVPTASDEFGRAVTMNHDTLFVGAPDGDVHVYDLTPVGVSFRTKLLPPGDSA